MPEQFLTVEQAAHRLHLRPSTIRRQLRDGALRGVKRGHSWRVPESALYVSSSGSDTNQNAADALWNEITSGDDARRSAAIKSLAKAPEAVAELVMQRSGEKAALYYATTEGQEEWEELEDWRALDGSPFHVVDEHGVDEEESA